MKKPLFTLFISFISITFASSAFAARSQFVTIGTGGVTGVYYPTGGAIAKMVNKKKKKYKIKATVESTGGSVFNINAVMTGDLEFGIAQSDRQYQAWNGISEWEKKGKQSKLRSVFSIHPESVTLIASADAGISSCKDLKGKRISVGAPGSGMRKNAKDALATCGLTFDDLGTVEGLKAAEGSKMLQDSRIDGYFYTVGHPNGSIKEASSGRVKVQFVPFTNTASLLKKFPYYANSMIAISNYPGVQNKKDNPTFGVKATLITSSDVSEDVVYAITKEVFENFDRFKRLHPAYANLTKKQLLEGLSAPLHRGAIKYYKEAGLIK